jgi:hypothetical protein
VALCGRPGGAAEPAPLAIKGYDPVSYFTAGKAERGSPEIEFEWDEHRYRFASAEHRDLFKADPVRYAPRFADFCAMALARGQVFEADPEVFLVSEGKLYLFSKAAGPDLFRRALTENIDSAQTNLPHAGKP